MGLDTTHGAWRGPYSSFNRWRTELAKRLGIPLSLMEGFYPRKNDSGFIHPFSMVMLAIENNSMGAKEQFERETSMFPLLWESFKPNPLHELLYHSDCDGELTPQQCKSIADSLDLIIKESPLPDGESDFIEKCIQFRDGCLLAYSKNETMIFQ